MDSLLVGFGDSWTFGSELDRPAEQNWLAQLSRELNVPYVNQSCPASGIGHLVPQLFNFIKTDPYPKHKKIFLIGLSGTTRYLTYSNQLNEFINITPEANYRTGNIKQTGQPPDTVDNFYHLSQELYKLTDCTEYNQFLVTQTLFLFENYCKQHNIDYLFFSYFDYLEPYSIVDTSKLFPVSLTKALTGKEYTLPNIRSHKYFNGKLFHPNQLGHQRISELLLEFYDQNYKRN